MLPCHRRASRPSYHDHFCQNRVSSPCTEHAVALQSALMTLNAGVSDSGSDRRSVVVSSHRAAMLVQLQHALTTSPHIIRSKNFVLEALLWCWVFIGPRVENQPFRTMHELTI